VQFFTSNIYLFNINIEALSYNNLIHSIANLGKYNHN
jgi:hypothetical protein